MNNRSFEYSLEGITSINLKKIGDRPLLDALSYAAKRYISGFEVYHEWKAPHARLEREALRRMRYGRVNKKDGK